MTKQVALITVLGQGCDINPGCHMITAGVRWLVRQALGDVRFAPVEMMQYHEPGWELAGRSDAAVVCGNPRYNADNSCEAFWDTGIWWHLARLAGSGVRVVDGWSGAAHPYPLRTIDEMAEAIWSTNKARVLSIWATMIHGRITRDPVMQRIYELAGVEATLLPCSAWFAPLEYRIEPREPKTHNLIVLRSMPGQEWIAKRLPVLRQFMSRQLPTYVLVSTWDDYRWVCSLGSDCLWVCDVRALLELYAAAAEVLSLRVHATIPAMALGARVCNLSMDSRSLTADEFGIQSVPFTAMQDRLWLPTFSYPQRPPDARRICEVLQEMCG